MSYLRIPYTFEYAPILCIKILKTFANPYAIQTFSTCWMIFEPGNLVFGHRNGQPAIANPSDGDYTQDRCGNDIFRLRCTMIDWDGESFGYRNHNFAVGAFSGTAKITELPAYPLNYHPKQPKVKADLIKRGKAFEALSGFHFKLYQGIAVGEGPWGPVKYNVSGIWWVQEQAYSTFT